MARTLKREDMVNILYGATLLGAGGGGSVRDGLKCMSDIEKTNEMTVTLIPTSEMEEGAYACSIAGVGSPAALRDHLFRDEAIYCFDALKHAAFFQSKPLKYLISGELGGFSTFAPMLVAVLKGLPMIDADGCGRAVPGLDVSLFNAHGIPTSPLALASSSGDSVVAYPANPFNGKQSEAIARNFCQSCGSIAAFGTWICSREEIETKLAVGAISFCETVGKTILEAKEKKAKNVAEMIGTMLPCRELATGTITTKKLEMKDGWDWGFNEITMDNGTKYYVDFKNENIVAKDENGKVEITAPDLITMLDLDTYTPLTNSDTQEGMRVQVMAMPVNKVWWSTPHGVDVWRPYFDTVGYTGQPVKF